MKEIWKPIPGYESCYSISNLGACARTSTYGKNPRKVWKLLAPRKKKWGYVTFHLCLNGVRKDPLVHRLVWLAFNGPVDYRLELNHKNGKKHDNRLENLEACTRSDNMKHSFRVLGRAAPNNPSTGSKNGSAKLTEKDIPKIRALYRSGMIQKDIGKKFGVSQVAISLVTRGAKWQHVKPD